MKLTIEIDTGDKASLQSLYDVARAMMGISGDAPAPQAKPASPPKAAATSAPAASPAPAAASPTPTTTAAPAAAAAPAADAPTVDLAGLSSLFQTFVKAKGPGAAKALLAEIGVSKVVDIPPDQFGAFAAKLAV